MAEESGRTLITPLIFNDQPVGRGETAYCQFEHYADTLPASSPPGTPSRP